MRGLLEIGHFILLFLSLLRVLLARGPVLFEELWFAFLSQTCQR